MAGYRITKQPEGTRVSYWPDPRGPGHPPLLWGTIIQHIGDAVCLVWDDDDEFYEQWSAAEIRYKIDRGQMRLKQPPKPRRTRIPKDELICKTCGEPRSKRCDCPRPGALKPEEWGSTKLQIQLLQSSEDDSMISSIEGKGETPPLRSTRKGTNTMARKTKDEAAIEEVADTDGGDTLSAKEAAGKIGTDARTLRKFLRSQHGLVGQGQRWAIAADDIPELKAKFDNWGKAKADSKPAAKPAPDADEVYDDLEDALEEIDDDELETI